MREKNKLPSNFYYEIKDILKKFSHTNNVEDCKIVMRDYIQPYCLDWSIEKLDEAFKQIRSDLIEEQLPDDELTGNYWHGIVDILHNPFGFSNKIEVNGISEEDFEEIVKYANMQYQNAFKKLRSIDN
ncbi:hypothetical protein P7J12_05545 [Streptococcus suis]|uniref:hypothetical protein n=1 Tax=Streptococcus suis TaxID=1307 RepID=UPI0038BA9F91